MVNKTVYMKEVRNSTKKCIVLNLNTVSGVVVYCEDVNYSVLMLLVFNVAY